MTTMIKYKKRSGHSRLKYPSGRLLVLLFLASYFSIVCHAFDIFSPTNGGCASTSLRKQPATGRLRQYKCGQSYSTPYLRAASIDPTSTSASPSFPSFPSSSTSAAAQWHRTRRQEMLAKYGDQIAPLERTANSQTLGLALLGFLNATLAFLSIYCGLKSNWTTTILLALFPGSILSLWQLQILHDNLHGCLLNKSKQQFAIPLGGKGLLSVSKKKLQQAILFWGSMPSIFGYYLYLKYGHLTHHQAVGNPQTANLRQVFESDQVNFEDGDVLFVAHRMKLLGQVGPRFRFKQRQEQEKEREIVMSISNTGFSNWKSGKPIVNAAIFATSFLFERFLLTINDVVVAVAGRNFFFLNKPKQFHQECSRYCRAAVLVRGILWFLGGSNWHSLFFLYLAETLWSIPPHPACAMFVTNHGSSSNANGDIAASPTDACIPSSSTYAGKWYSILTLGTNYHCEHHDFPTIPLHKLGKLRQIAPEYYRRGTNDRLGRIMQKTFAKPDYYACMNDMDSVR